MLGKCGHIIKYKKIDDFGPYIWYCFYHGQVEPKKSKPMFLEDFGVLKPEDFRDRKIYEQYK